MLKWLFGGYDQTVDRHDEELRALRQENEDLRNQLLDSQQTVKELSRQVQHHRHLAESDKEYLKLLIDVQIRKAQLGYSLDRSLLERL